MLHNYCCHGYSLFSVTRVVFSAPCEWKALLYIVSTVGSLNSRWPGMLFWFFSSKTPIPFMEMNTLFHFEAGPFPSQTRMKKKTRMWGNASRGRRLATRDNSGTARSCVTKSPVGIFMAFKVSHTTFHYILIERRPNLMWNKTHFPVWLGRYRQAQVRYLPSNLVMGKETGGMISWVWVCGWIRYCDLWSNP